MVEYEKDGSEYDTRQAELQTIGEIIKHVNYWQFKASNQQNMENIRKYNNIVRLLFFNIANYAKDQDKIRETKKDLDQIKEVLRNNPETLNKTNIYDMLEDIRWKVDNLRQDANLALPQKTKVNPEESALEGL